MILSPAPKPCGARALGDRKPDRQKLRHAASFAELSYASAYMRRHYPAEFFAAVLDSQPMGFYSPRLLLNEARRIGLSVLPPEVHRPRAGTAFTSC